MPRPGANSTFVSEIESGYLRPAILVQLGLTTGTLYLWSGSGSKTWAGNTYQGVGQFGALSTIEEGSDITARGITLTLSGIDLTLLSDALNDYRQGLPVMVYFGLLDASGNVAAAIASWSGRTDQPTIAVDGSTASISIACENRLVSMNTSIERRYTTADQQIDYPGDLGFSFVPMIQDITIYFGRHPSTSNNFSVQGTS